MKSNQITILLLVFQPFFCAVARQTWPVPDEVKVKSDFLLQRAIKRQNGNATGSVGASMLAPTAYYWYVTALVNGQPVALMIDTGSSDFAPSPEGDTPGAPIMRVNNQSASFNITYQTQSNASTSGPVVATQVQLGGLIVPDYGVGVATQLAFGYPLDGFMGLAFQALNTGMQWLLRLLAVI
ncbi:MAG: hypothetical protein Q9202_005803 [Teloschistes flavicans]